MTRANTLRLLIISSAFCLATGDVVAAQHQETKESDASLCAELDALSKGYQNSANKPEEAAPGLLKRSLGACRRCPRRTKHVVVDRPLELARDYVASPLYNRLPTCAQRLADGMIATLSKRGVQLAVAIPVALYFAHEAAKYTHPTFHAEWHDTAMHYKDLAISMLSPAQQNDVVAHAIPSELPTSPTSAPTATPTETPTSGYMDVVANAFNQMVTFIVGSNSTNL